MTTQKNNTGGEEKHEINHIIHTYESDAYAAIKNKKLDSLHIHALETDTKNGIEGDIALGNNNDYKKGVILIAGFIFVCVLIITGYYFYNKPVPTPVVVVPVKQYTIHDTWPQIGNVLDNYTDYSTSTDTYIIIHVTDFDNMYAYILQNEPVFIALARDRFQLNTLGAFKDVTVKNYDLRVADGYNGLLVYGYKNKQLLIISNSVEGWLSAVDKQ
jgi:hypothetical protein